MGDKPKAGAKRITNQGKRVRAGVKVSFTFRLLVCCCLFRMLFLLKTSSSSTTSCTPSSYSFACVSYSKSKNFFFPFCFLFLSFLFLLLLLPNACIFWSHTWIKCMCTHVFSAFSLWFFFRLQLRHPRTYFLRRIVNCELTSEISFLFFKNKRVNPNRWKMKHQDIPRKCLHRRSISSTKRTKEINTAIVTDTVKYIKKRYIHTTTNGTRRIRDNK